MSHSLIKISLVLFLSTISYIANSQEQRFEIKYIGFGWHPSDEEMNADHMPLKLDDKGNYMINLGLTTSYERYFKNRKRWGYEFMGAFYYDCAMMPDMVLHIGFRGVIFKTEKHSLNGGIGPTILMRRNWSSKFDSYIPSGYFNGDKDDYLQWRFFWYGGEVEYNYAFNDYNFFSLSIIPGYPKYVALFFGYEHVIGAKKMKQKSLSSKK